MNNKLDPNFRTILIAAVTSFVVAVIATAGLFTYLLSRTDSSSSWRLPPIISRGSSEGLVVEAVKKANPAVVAITISKNVPVGRRYALPSPFSDFFSLIPPYQNPGQGTQKQDIGGGSGFLVSADGYVVTNRHVVADEEAEYTVFTNDGEKHSAAVVAQDSALDLALLKIEGDNYPYLGFGDSDQLVVGQTAIAIGNALGEFRNTVSVGVISGLSRSIVAGSLTGQAEALDQVIQTDAAINSGNSGGPLLNLAGEVIGINVAMASGAAESIGFALPANEVKNAVATVVAGGKIVRPYLGVRYIPVTEQLKTKNNLPFDYGVLVARGQTTADLAVIPGSPADKAGIVENDLILEVDGVKLTAEKPLSSIIRSKKVGDSLALKLWHRGAARNVKVLLEAMGD